MSTFDSDAAANVSVQPKGVVKWEDPFWLHLFVMTASSALEASETMLSTGFGLMRVLIGSFVSEERKPQKQSWGAGAKPSDRC